MSDSKKTKVIQEKPRKLDLKFFTKSMLLDMYAQAKASKDVKQQRRINYELKQRGTSVRRSSSTIKAAVNQRMSVEQIN